MLKAMLWLLVLVAVLVDASGADDHEIQATSGQKL